jgi:surfactin family lipopeptide synthetase A
MRLTLQQEDIFFDQQLFPGAPIYNIGAKIEIKGALDVEAINQAYIHLISHHDIFHSCLIEGSNGPELKVQEEYTPYLQIMDLSTRANAMEEAETYMHKASTMPFDLSANDPLHRFGLIRVVEDLHYLFFVCHHIITDGWGTSLMFQRLTELYNDIILTGSVQHKYDYPYINYLNKDILYRGSESYQDDAGYWKEKFTSLPESLIPRKSTNERSGGFISARKVLNIKRQDYDKLNELARANDASTFHVLLACIYTYLGRVYDNQDFAIGLPVLNRGSKQFKQTVGLFMGISPLRIAMDLESSFTEIVKQVKNELRKDYRHQSFPLGHIIQQLQLYEQKDRLFNVTFSYEKHDYAHAFHNTNTRVLPFTHGSERVALAIYVREFDEQEDVKVDLDYNIGYFDEADADMLVRRLEKLLKEVINEPAKPAYANDLMDSSELSTLLHAFNDTALIYPAEKTIVDLVYDAAEMYHTSIAIMDRERSYTYQEVKQYADAVAGYLQRQQLAGGGAPVGIMMDRSGKMLITMIGILASGAAYIPLDPSFPKERLEYIVEQSGCQLLVADEQYMEVFTGKPALKIIRAEDLHDRSMEQTDLLHKPVSGDLAYIIYTSGSTGQPKGVEISHRSVVNFLTSMRIAPGITPTDKFLAVTTYSFDISVLEFFLPLVTGATVYIADKGVTSDPEALIHLMGEIKPSIMQATPSLWHMLFVSGWTGDSGLKVLCGGEPLDHAIGQKILANCRELWNMYGPTETTIWSAIKQINRPGDIDVIGKPIGNTTVYILDHWRRPMPIGAVGEIYIGGAGLAKGYRLREDLTTERFIQSPFVKGERIYRTGDVGRWLHHGEIAFLGRKDDQVKIRGYRVELGEIERQLLQIEGVSQAVVVARKSDDLRTFLAAFIVSGETVNDGDVREVLRTKLPEYMIPSAFIAIDEIPVTPNGKVDRKALIAMELAGVVSAATYEAPANGVEKDLQVLWEKILGIRGPGVSDNFFSLGGHSLNATQLINDIYRLFGIKLKLRSVFLNPTIRLLAKCMMEQERGAFQPIPVAPEAQSYPLSPNQEGIWMATQTSNGGLAYNMTGVYSVEGPLSVQALEAAIRMMISRHESLRTGFIEQNGQVNQKILSPDLISFNISVHNSDEQDLLVDALVQYQFELDKPPLIKVDMINVGKDKSILVFVLHHIIADGWSLNVLLNEVTSLYHEYNKDKEYKLPQLPVQYKDYTVWLLDRLKSGQLEKHQQYWLGQFENVDTRPVLKADKEMSVHTSFNGAMVHFEVESAIVSGLTGLASENNATLFMALLAAMNALFYRESGHRDICIGTPVAGREHPYLENQIGLYVNTLALRMTFEKDHNFLQLLQKVRTVVLDGFAHQEYPYISDKRSLFDVLIVLQSRGTDVEDIRGFGDTIIKRRPVAQSVSRFPLVFNFYQREGALSCEAEYNSDLFLPETIQILVARFLKVIAAVIADPEETLDRLDLLLDFEKSVLAPVVSIDLDL